MITDIHNHILPGVDDGAENLDVAKGMLQEAQRQGIGHLVLTPHLYEPDIIKGTADWMQRIESATRAVRALIQHENLDIQITQAAEVRFQGMLEIILQELPVLIGERYLLLEFSFGNVPLGVENAIYDLFRKGITPIIAHPERIKPWQRDPGQLAELINMGCPTQLDTGSILGRLGPSAEKLSLQLLDAGAGHLCGSDSHNLGSRPLLAEEGFDWIDKEYGIDLANLLFKDNPGRVVAGDPLEVYPVELTSRKTDWKQRIAGLFK